MLAAISFGFSILSIIFYSIVYFPQFYLMYRRKTNDGLSYYTVILWTLADSMSLVASLLLELEVNVLVICWYHLFMGLGMTNFVFYFKYDKSLFQKIGVVVFNAANIATNVCFALCADQVVDRQVIGTAIGWITSAIYIIGRFPQFYQNYQRRSVEGLSYLMYIYTILGNFMFLLSVVVFSNEQEYLKINLPWIVLPVITICLDILLLVQYKYYFNYNRNLIRSRDTYP